MRIQGRFASVLASAVLVLAVATSVHAQSKSNGKGNGHKSSAPSSSPLPSPTAGPAAGASPLAWLDDATLLAPGSMSVTISALRWSGTDLSEVNFPIVQAAVGLAPRFQIGATVPRIVGSADGTGPVEGVGTSYISSKIALLTGASGVKVAVSPVIEVLGAGAVQALAPGEGRMQFGLPVSAEVGQGPVRVFASTGFFSRGVWFAGGGAAIQARPRLGMSLSFSRAWAGDALTGLSRDRRDLSGGASYVVRPQMAVFGSIGRTIATSDADGAGTTVSGGVSFVLGPSAIRRRK
jgi:hypothetical protein